MLEGARGGRTRAREVVFRAVFEADATGESPIDVLELSLGRFRFTPDGRAYALRLAGAVGDRAEEIDTIMVDLLKRWSIERLSSVVRAIVRLAVGELLVIPESPSKVIIMEAVRLADRYGEEESGTFVNGVVDAAARRIRPGSLDVEPDATA
jgi:transcription antitermination protein NusB